VVHHRFWLIMLEESAFYAAFAGLLPMTLIGVPLSRTSSLWRALGRSYEEAIAFHRALGHLMMAACAFMSNTSLLYRLVTATA
jgi:hypothetical protein